MGTIEPVVPCLAGILASASMNSSGAADIADSEGTRAIAAFVIGRLGEAVRPFVPLLLESLSDPSPRVRMSIIGALGSLGEVALPAVKRLTEIAEDCEQDEDVRQAAAETVATIRS